MFKRKLSVKDKIYEINLDLYDRRVVLYVIRDNNNNALAFNIAYEAKRIY